MDPLDDLDNNDILTAIRNSTGLKTSLFLPECAFELLVKKQVKKLELPSLNCVSQVADEMLKIVYQIAEFIRFPTLKDKVFEIVKQVLTDEKEPTCGMKKVTNLIKAEISYINTNHPDFVEVANLTSFKHNNIDTPHIPSLKFPSLDLKEKDETDINGHMGTKMGYHDRRLDDHSKILIKDHLIDRLITESPNITSQRENNCKMISV
ncbi:hypothetical protein MXB_1939 [Myxobolus squamalis]|nr:hypothetical protein MXB_1939 [Myxobolus squamalis]